MVTAELAVAMPVVVLVAALMVSGISLALDQVRCVDAARAAAREVARGESGGRAEEAARRLAPAGASVSLSAGADLVRVRVNSPPPGLLSLLGMTRGAEGEAVVETERPPGALP